MTESALTTSVSGRATASEAVTLELAGRDWAAIGLGLVSAFVLAALFTIGVWGALVIVGALV